MYYYYFKNFKSNILKILNQFIINTHSQVIGRTPSLYMSYLN